MYSVQCVQLELSLTCRNDVGISIFLFDHTMPNLTATMLRGAPVENIAITSSLGPIIRVMLDCCFVVLSCLCIDALIY